MAFSSSDGIATSRSWNAATPFWKVAIPGRCCLLVLNSRTNSPSWQALQNTWWPWVCSWTQWGPLLRRCIPPPRRTFVGTSVTASPAPRASSDSAERGTREQGGALFELTVVKMMCLIFLDISLRSQSPAFLKVFFRAAAFESTRSLALYSPLDYCFQNTLSMSIRCLSRQKHWHFRLSIQRWANANACTGAREHFQEFPRNYGRQGLGKRYNCVEKIFCLHSAMWTVKLGILL